MCRVKRRPAPISTPRSESTEDHLERIQELVDGKGYARVTDIADALGLRPSTVSNMVRRLAARGYVNYERYRGFTLTETGRQVANDIKQRHRVLHELFALLGLPPAVAEAEIEDIEHHLRPQTLGALERLVHFWQQRPAQHRAFRDFQG
jgi:Mn-dependent DtxR family transcriptional regulator